MFLIPNGFLYAQVGKIRRTPPPGVLDKRREFGYSHKVADELSSGY